MLEASFALLKPEAVENHLIGEIIGRLEKVGLRVVALQMLTASREVAEEHYGEEIEQKYGREVRECLLQYICSGPVVAMVLAGEDAIGLVRRTSGEKANPPECPPGTIRRDLGTDTRDAANAEKRALQNLIHSSDSPESAAREIELWFGREMAQKLQSPAM